MIQHLAAWSLALTALSAAPTIEQLAPENSMVVVGVDDFAGALERLKATPLWGLWQAPEIRELLKEPMESFNKELDEALQDLGLDREALVGPQGPVGLAIFPGPGRDPDRQPGFLAMADFGDQIDRVSKLVDAMIARHEEDEEEPLAREEVLGRTVFTIPMSDLTAHAPGADVDVDDLPMGQMMPDPEQVLDKIKEVYFTRDGSRYLLCSSQQVLHETLELVDEDGQSGLAEREDFRTVRQRLGAADGWAVIGVERALAELAAADPTVMMMAGMFRSVLGDISAIGAGVRFGADGAMVEQKCVLEMPGGKGGLTKLFQVESPQGKLPGFVGPDVLTYNRTNFDFGGVMGFLRGLAADNPMLGLDQWLLQHGVEVEQVCATLGPQIHSMITVTAPLKIDSLKALYAIESREPQKVEEIIARYAPNMGLQPRDFAGHRIYSMSPDMMGGLGTEGLSIGFGAGYVMLGQTSAVEDGLRGADRGARAGLSDNPVFRRALGAMRAQRTVSWGVMNVVELLGDLMEMDLVAMQAEIEQFKQWDAEYAQELQQAYDEKARQPWRKLDMSLLNRYLGAVAWEARSTEAGFEVRSVLMPPEAEK